MRFHKFRQSIYIPIVFITFASYFPYNNTILKLSFSIKFRINSLAIWLRKRINREWRKGIIAANWPDHFPSGATRRSIRRERRSDRGKERASCETHTNGYARHSARQVRPVLIAIEHLAKTSRFGQQVVLEAKSSEREAFKKEANLN